MITFCILPKPIYCTVVKLSLSCFKNAPPVVRWTLPQTMQLSEVYLGLGLDAFGQLVRSISIGKLKTFQIYEGFKVRAHLHKVNTEILRKAVPRFWTRISEHDEDFSRDLAQAVLVSHLDMITAVLDWVGVPHENGFF